MCGADGRHPYHSSVTTEHESARRRQRAPVDAPRPVSERKPRSRFSRASALGADHGNRQRSKNVGVEEAHLRPPGGRRWQAGSPPTSIPQLLEPRPLHGGIGPSYPSYGGRGVRNGLKAKKRCSAPFGQPTPAPTTDPDARYRRPRNAMPALPPEVVRRCFQFLPVGEQLRVSRSVPELESLIRRARWDVLLP